MPLTLATLNDYLTHIQDRKKEFWGKVEIIYLFYHAQEVLLLDLISKEKDER